MAQKWHFDKIYQTIMKIKNNHLAICVSTYNNFLSYLIYWFTNFTISVDEFYLKVDVASN